MKLFLFAIFSALQLGPKVVLGTSDVLSGREVSHHSPKPPKDICDQSYTEWMKEHMRALFDVSQTEEEAIAQVDATYSANATLVFNGSPVTVAFLKSTVFGQLQDAKRIDLRWENVIELQKTPSDNCTKIVAGVIFLKRNRLPPNRTTTSTDVFILTIGIDPVAKGKDKRRIIDSVSVVVTK